MIATDTGKRVAIKDAVRQLRAIGAGRSRATIFGHIAAGRLKSWRKPGVSRDTFVDLDALADLVDVPRTHTARPWWTEEERSGDPQ